VVSQVVALIPARGGSQGVPRKNLAMVGAFSLLERAFLSASKSDRVHRICVSSEDEEILAFARSLGAVALRRPQELAGNSSRAEGVVEHFLHSEAGSDLGMDDVIVYLQPTSPFRQSRHVGEAVDLLLRSGAPSVVSVKAATEYPAKAVRVDAQEFLRSVDVEDNSTANRQDLPAAHYPNGAIYAFRVGVFTECERFPIIGAKSYLMDTISSIDIDTVDDLEIARGVAEYAGI